MLDWPSVLTWLGGVSQIDFAALCVTAAFIGVAVALFAPRNNRRK